MIAKIVFSVCLIIAACATAFAQTSGPRIDLSLIVTDKANKPLSTVRKEDVRVFENKIEQTVISIDPDERPADVALVIDSSGSLRSSMPLVVEAAKRIIDNRRSNDEFFVETFVSSDKIRQLQDFTGNGDTLTRALTQIRVEGGQSAVLDGIYVGAAYLAKHNRTPVSRKVLVLITDGEDRNSRSRLDEVLKQLQTENIQVFAIGLVTELDVDAGLVRKSPRAKAEKLLTTVAEESGGLVVFPKNEKDLINAADLIGAALRTQFHLAYQSTKEFTQPEFRNVEVKLISTNGEKRKAFTPSGYHVEAKDINNKPTEPKSP